MIVSSLFLDSFVVRPLPVALPVVVVADEEEVCVTSVGSVGGGTVAPYVVNMFGVCRSPNVKERPLGVGSEPGAASSGFTADSSVDMGDFIG